MTHPFLASLRRLKPREDRRPRSQFRVIYPDGSGTTFFREGTLGGDLWVAVWRGENCWETGEVKTFRPVKEPDKIGADGVQARWMLAERIG